MLFFVSYSFGKRKNPHLISAATSIDPKTFPFRAVKVTCIGYAVDYHLVECKSVVVVLARWVLWGWLRERENNLRGTGSPHKGDISNTP